MIVRKPLEERGLFSNPAFSSSLYLSSSVPYETLWLNLFCLSLLARVCTLSSAH
jgi:hypothetical protein